MEDRDPRSFDRSTLREALARRLHRRAMAEGTLHLPAVPGMLDEYLTMCTTIFAGLGIRYTDEESAQLKTVLQGELAKAFKASSRSNIVLQFTKTFGTTLNYRVKPQWATIGADYDNWVDTREGSLFGTEPDARVWALASEAADPSTCRVLDIGAGTGRNALALARRGHPVDAVELAGKFADIIRAEAKRNSVDIRVIQSDVFVAMEGVRGDYQLVVLAEVVPDFRTPQELRGVFELAAQCLAPGGCLVFNTFLPRGGYAPDDAARQLGQQCHTTIFTRDEVSDAADGLSLELISDESAYEYEKAHLPEGAWPPTAWFDGWASGQDVFDVEREDSPIELRWLVYRKVG
ncbi:class I SAM-dependent methyltransferase [Mycobacterium stomatepiae]|nr:class I SAM-dependent methyltransferase [Mycobacterium stomatepiae]MCV7165387.1 class I SAM-dependent methyltransferase [Mycobacterium stomatepiae]